MRANLELTGGLALSEVIMLELGRFIGRQVAHDVVYRLAMQTVETGGSFRKALLADPEVAAHLSPVHIDALLQPEHYLGAAPACVDQVLQQCAPRDGSA